MNFHDPLILSLVGLAAVGWLSSWLWCWRSLRLASLRNERERLRTMLLDHPTFRQALAEGRCIRFYEDGDSFIADIGPLHDPQHAEPSLN